MSKNIKDSFTLLKVRSCTESHPGTVPILELSRAELLVRFTSEEAQLKVYAGKCVPAGAILLPQCSGFETSPLALMFSSPIEFRHGYMFLRP